MLLHIGNCFHFFDRSEYTFDVPPDMWKWMVESVKRAYLLIYKYRLLSNNLSSITLSFTQSMF